MHRYGVYGTSLTRGTVLIELIIEGGQTARTQRRSHRAMAPHRRPAAASPAVSVQILQNTGAVLLLLQLLLLLLRLVLRLLAQLRQVGVNRRFARIVALSLVALR